MVISGCHQPYMHGAGLFSRSQSVVFCREVLECHANDNSAPSQAAGLAASAKGPRTTPCETTKRKKEKKSLTSLIKIMRGTPKSIISPELKAFYNFNTTQRT